MLKQVFCALLMGLSGMVCAQVADAEPLSPSTLEALSAKADQLSLADHRQWQLLLHRPLEGGDSQVVDDDFFLSPEGRHDARAELQATLLALSKPMSEAEPDQHARCRYPARHVWLLSALGLPSEGKPDSRCRALHRWVNFADIRSLQVILVSGYFGNPASAFGHSLIRISTHSNSSSGGLADMSINFGALVPEGENPLRYIYRGITGKYAAGFTEREFLEHDRVYARTENRDLWTYDLKLTQAQQWLVVAHMWELVGRRFTYYFFSRNCAWRMAELVELALPGPLRRAEGDPWYVPVELVQRFDAQVDLRDALGPVLFEPSAARQLHAQIEALTESEREHLFDIAEQRRTLAESLQYFSEEKSQKRLIEAVLAWAAWKDPVGGHAGQMEVKALKTEALLARLRLPVGSEKVRLPPIESPAIGTAPMRWGVAAAGTRRSGVQGQLVWAPVHFEAGGFNALEGGELKMAELTAAWTSDHGLQLDRVTAVSALRLPQSQRALPGEQEWAWSIHVGAFRRAPRDPASEPTSSAMRTAVELAGGKGLRWSQKAMSYAMVQLESAGQDVALLPRVGMQWHPSDDWHITADWRPGCKVTDAYGGCAQVKLLWRMAPNRVLRLGVAGGAQTTRAFLGLDWHQ